MYCVFIFALAARKLRTEISNSVTVMFNPRIIVISFFFGPNVLFLAVVWLVGFAYCKPLCPYGKEMG